MTTEYTILLKIKFFIWPQIIIIKFCLTDCDDTFKQASS
jgi:hypothetical protein